MALIPIKDLVTTTIDGEKYLVLGDPDGSGVAGKVKVTTFAAFIGVSSDIALKGTLSIGDTPEDGWYFADNEGNALPYTYTNAGNVEQTEELAVIAVTEGATAFSIINVPIDLTGYLTEADVTDAVAVGNDSPLSSSGAAIEFNQFSELQIAIDPFFANFQANKEWNNTGTTQTASGKYASAAITVAEGDKIYISGLDTSLLASNIGRIYTAGNASFGAITPAALADYGDFKVYTIPATYVKAGLTITTADFNAGVEVYVLPAGDLFETRKIKEESLPPYVTPDTLESSTIDIVSNERKLIALNGVSFSSGYYNTSSTNIVASGASSHSNLISVIPLDKIYIDNALTATSGANNMGKAFNALGAVVYTFVFDDDIFTDDNGQYLLVPDNANITTIGLNILNSDLANSISFEKETRNTDYKLREDILPDTVVKNLSDDTAIDFYLRGQQEKNYTAALPELIEYTQSNGDGRELQANLPAPYLSTIPNIQIWNRFTGAYANAALGTNAGADSQTESRFSYNWILYQKYQTYKGGLIYVNKRSKGGTPLASNIALDPSENDSFNPDFDAIEVSKPGANPILKEFEQQLRLGKTYKTANTINTEVKCLLINQGETDASYLEWKNAYYQNQKNAIAYVRGVVGNPKLKVVLQGIHPDSSAYSQIIRNAKVKIASEDPYVYFYNPDALTWTHIGDDLHADAAYCVSFAEGVFQIIKDF